MKQVNNKQHNKQHKCQVPPGRAFAAIGLSVSAILFPAFIALNLGRIDKTAVIT